MVALNFNAAGVKPNAALEAIPTGQYPVVIIRSEEKPTKAGTGKFIELEMQIQGGEYAGRKVFDRLNIVNPNQQAVDIAYGTLSAICHVTGRLNITDTQQLHGVPFIAVVSKLPRDDRPDQMTNEIKGYKDINGNDPGFAGTVSTPAAQPQWAQNGAPAAAPAPAQQPPQTPQQATYDPNAAPNWAQQPQQVAQQQQPAPQQQQQQQPAPQQQAPNPGAPPTWAQPQQAAS